MHNNHAQLGSSIVLASGPRRPCPVCVRVPCVKRGGAWWCCCMYAMPRKASSPFVHN